jgi:hypothetical protein
MARTTFQGPVRSLAGFYTQGPDTVVNLPNGTNTITLDVANYAGKIIRTNDATLVITLPTINSDANPTTSGPGEDPNNLNNVGTSYTFFVETTASALTIRTDGTTDKFVGSLAVVDTDSGGTTTQNVAYAFAPAASNDFINLNGTTTGGVAGSMITVTVLAAAKYMVSGVLLGTGTVATPFADS